MKYFKDARCTVHLTVTIISKLLVSDRINFTKFKLQKPLEKHLGRNKKTPIQVHNGTFAHKDYFFKCTFGASEEDNLFLNSSADINFHEWSGHLQ
jgi:hypothetical protein